MPLQGTFDVLDFSSVLEILASHSMTGRLHVRSRSFAANLFFADGQIVGADQSEHQAAAVAGDVTQRAREICFELLDTDRGNFEFHPGKPNAVLGNTIMTVAQALEDARQRLTEWHELQELIPSLDVQPRLVTELDPGQVTLDRDQWRVLTAVDGRRNLRSIGRMLNMSDFEVCRAMGQLLTAKVIEFDMRPAGMATINEIDIPVTEQVTINGKRATRLRPERAHAKVGQAGADDANDGGQTIVISPNKPRSEVKPVDLTEEPETVELGAGELGAGELGAGELGAGELGAGELGAGELGAGEPQTSDGAPNEVGRNAVGPKEAQPNKVDVAETEPGPS